MRPPASVAKIFVIFLKLGCIAFGGPVAHLGFFREEFVKRRRWLDDATYADLIALCQFLPGPASSQTGFAIGYRAGGVAGAFAAWCGFTLPSALLMILFALALHLAGPMDSAGWLQGLKVAAAAVVAKAVWGMAVKLCPGPVHVTIAVLGACALILHPVAWMQVAVIVVGALVGLRAFRAPAHAREDVDKTSSAGSADPAAARPRLWHAGLLATFFILLAALPILSAFIDAPHLAAFDKFYRAGSLVFGGGHVVLPLLESSLVGPGWVDRGTFLAGYGAAQAVPGPLFTFSTFLGAASPVLGSWPSWLNGIWCLLAIYLPSWLLLLGVLPYWERLRCVAKVQAALVGTNAAVVGLLLAAFYNPVLSAAVLGPATAAMALLAFLALQFWRLPPWALVIAAAALGHVVL